MLTPKRSCDPVVSTVRCELHATTAHRGKTRVTKKRRRTGVVIGDPLGETRPESGSEYIHGTARVLSTARPAPRTPERMRARFAFMGADERPSHHLLRRRPAGAQRRAPAAQRRLPARGGARRVAAPPAGVGARDRA